MYDKIYSRKRFLIKPLRNYPRPHRNSRNIKKRKKVIKILIIILLVIIIYKVILNYVDPIFEGLCEDQVKSVATVITNQQSTMIMNKYQYNELYSIEKDDNGKISMIKANVVPVNNMISDLTENIQNEFDEIEKSNIEVPLGSLFGTYFLSGIGPNIPIKVLMSGTLDTEIKNEFETQAINQTLHRTYVEFECNMKILTPLSSYSKTITNQVIVGEHVIIGEIPSTFYDLEGITSPEETLNVID